MFKLDLGTFVVLITLVSFLTAAIGFPFIRRNSFFGIRVSKSYESEEIWHKIHVIAAIITIPFIIALGIILFLQNSITKLLLSFVIIITLIVIYLIIPEVSTKKYIKQKQEQERKELELQIKKESGWR